MTLAARTAVPGDAGPIAQIYNEGIRERTATFETRPRSVEEILKWFDGVHPIIVVESDGEVVAFAATSQYRLRECYAGVAECSVYVTAPHRLRGAGRLALDALIEAAGAAGFWKLLSRIFVENAASRALIARSGFREVGVYERHAKLDGVWRDVVIVERLLTDEKQNAKHTDSSQRKHRGH